MEEALALLNESASLVLATSDAHGTPYSSYAPFIRDGHGALYIFVSNLAAHTSNLRERPIVSCMVIEDEVSSDNIFARKRLVLDCSVAFVDNDDDSNWNSILDALASRHGDTVTTLRELPDFNLVRLVPLKGTLVTGFAAATPLRADNAAGIIPATTDNTRRLT